jgi:hypothetical protein
MTPDSLFFVAFTITMTFIVVSFRWGAAGARVVVRMGDE